MLENMWIGINSTAFAYGQTGSGKSYSFFGYGANRGIVPMAADKIFERQRSNTDVDIKFQTTVQMVEIYMEKINDLLVEPKDRKKDCKVRQSGDQIWVENARKEPVSNYEQITKYMEMGDKNRSIASTAMNQTSSRAHTIVTIEMEKHTGSGGKSSKVTSILNLVDLAGSEKQDQA
jgi:kinesin family protein 1